MRRFPSVLVNPPHTPHRMLYDDHCIAPPRQSSALARINLDGSGHDVLMVPVQVWTWLVGWGVRGDVSSMHTAAPMSITHTQAGVV